MIARLPLPPVPYFPYLSLGRLLIGYPAFRKGR
jgi:hypothetical protein